MAKTITTVLTILLTCLPLWAQGETTIDLSASDYAEGYRISTAGTYRFTGTYSGTPGQSLKDYDWETQDRKAVIAVAANAGNVTIILDGVTIALTGEFQCPLSAKQATGTVTVMLKGENKLSTTHSQGECPALWAPEGGGSLVIKDDGSDAGIGSLSAQGACYWPGIGIQNGKETGSITIESGTIDAKGGDHGAGIGISLGGSIATINILGGTVTATGGQNAAGIGCGLGGNVSTISISGGKVTATGGYYAAGIGCGNTGSSVGTIIISGGTVVANGNSGAAGIGDGASKETSHIGTFSTGENGTAYIKANSISGNDDKSGWSGIIFEGDYNVGVYGTQTLNENLTEIGQTLTLTIAENATLIIPEDKTLKNTGKIVKYGTIEGKVDHTQFSKNLTGLTANMIIVTEGSYPYTGMGVTPDVAVTIGTVNIDYTVAYSDNINAGENTAKVTVTPESKSNQLGGAAVTKTFTITKATNTWNGNLSITGWTYGETVHAPTATAQFGTPEFTYSETEGGAYIKTKPTNAGTYYVKATVAGTDNYEELVATSRFEIAKADPSIKLTVPEGEALVYSGTAKEATAQVKGVEGETAVLTATVAYYSDEGHKTPAEGTTNAGTYYVKVTFAGNNNYNAANATGKFTIAKANPNITLTVPEGDALVYNGEAKEATAEVKGVAGETATLTATVAYYSDDSYQTPAEGTTNAGTYYVKATFAGDNNYEAADATDNFTIKKAPASISYATKDVVKLNTDGSFINPLTNEKGANVTYSSNKTSVATVDENTGEVSIVTAGEATITATVTDANYETTTASYTLKVREALGEGAIAVDGKPITEIRPEDSFELTATVTKDGLGTNGTWTWTSSALAVATVVEKPSTLRATTSSSIATVTPLTAGTTIITATYTDDTYTGSVSYDLTVKPLSYTITVDPDIKNGTVTPDKLAATEGETVTLTVTPAGSYSIGTVSYTVDGGGEVALDKDYTFKMPAGNVTVSATFRYNSPYLPSYYDLHFEPNDSVLLSSSQMTVTEGSTFTIEAEVAAGYDPETLLMEYRRGLSGSWRALEPESNGQYRIRNVYTDIYVRASVRPLGDPTANVEVESEVTVKALGRTLYIYTPKEETVSVYTAGGKLLKLLRVAGDGQVWLPAGIYIVRIADKSYKVAVRHF